jgi:D-alanine-D-alanine ligase
LPLFVKPACEGSSIGISKVKQAGELARRMPKRRGTIRW